ncbi:hypothetical protein ACA910_014036 [Epithemia clementina (nom. ined.)]
MQTSIAPLSDSHEASSYEEAILQQHPDIEDAMDWLCNAIAECDINNSDPMCVLFREKLEQAIIRQHFLGSRARYMRVRYNVVEPDDVYLHLVAETFFHYFYCILPHDHLLRLQ